MESKIYGDVATAEAKSIKIMKDMKGFLKRNIIVEAFADLVGASGNSVGLFENCPEELAGRPEECSGRPGEPADLSERFTDCPAECADYLKEVAN